MPIRGEWILLDLAFAGQTPDGFDTAIRENEVAAAAWESLEAVVEERGKIL
jgi:hypothetical protein